MCEKEYSLNGAEKFLRKLAGMADLEDALKKLDRLTQEEARMANAEVLRITNSIRDGVKIVDDKVQVVIDGERALSCRLLNTSNLDTFRRQASKSRDEGHR